MYFNANIEIDPKYAEKSVSFENSGLMNKILRLVGAGSGKNMVAKESYTALSVLQNIYNGLSDSGVSNLIWLTVDEMDYYIDELGEDDDLKKGVEIVKETIDPVTSEYFDHIHLVSEHTDEILKYLIDIHIDRRHKVSEWPIKLRVIAVFKDLMLKEGETKDSLVSRMEYIFSEEANYEDYVSTRKQHFEDFLDRLEDNLIKYIAADGIKRNTTRNIIRPKRTIERKYQMKQGDIAHPLYFDYKGLKKYFFYCWHWGEQCHRFGLYLQNTVIVDEKGCDVATIKEIGVSAGESDTLNPQTSFTGFGNPFVTYHEGNDYEIKIRRFKLIKP